MITDHPVFRNYTSAIEIVRSGNSVCHQVFESNSIKLTSAHPLKFASPLFTVPDFSGLFNSLFSIFHFPVNNNRLTRDHSTRTAT